ncbi:MAG: acylphosphatase [Calditrichia bacterium]
MAHVSGNVQGVGFRYFTYKRAKSYNLTGYVKNLANGNVEVFAEGDRGDLEKLHTQHSRFPGQRNTV